MVPPGKSECRQSDRMVDGAVDTQNTGLEAECFGQTQDVPFRYGKFTSGCGGYRGKVLVECGHGSDTWATSTRRV